MRLVEGTNLATMLQHGPLPPRRVVDIITQVAAALDAAHNAGLVHRDIKPANVLITGTDAGTRGNDFVYVADFGIARAVDGSTSGSFTSTGTTVGSLDYIAPERFDRDPGDRPADIYALGCVLYQALKAQRPFPVDGLPAMINAHLNTPPPAASTRRPGIPASLDAVIARAMAKNPEDRYPTAAALAIDARHALDDDTHAALLTPTALRAIDPLADASWVTTGGAGTAEPMGEEPATEWSQTTGSIPGRPPRPDTTPPSPRRRPTRRTSALLAAAVLLLLALSGAVIWPQVTNAGTARPVADSRVVAPTTTPATTPSPTPAPTTQPPATQAHSPAANPAAPRRPQPAQDPPAPIEGGGGGDQGPAPLKITTHALHAITEGEAYSAKLEVTGGVEPYSWTVSSGRLPEGVNLDPSSGELSGFTELTGVPSVDITVTVTDAQHPADTDSAHFTVNIIAKVCSVPDITGKSKDEATQLLKDARCGVYWYYVADNDVPDDIVRHQDTAAGTAVPAGTAIHFSVARNFTTSPPSPAN